LADILGFDLARARFRPDSVAVASTTETVAGLLLPLLPSSTLDDLVARMDARAAALPQVEAAPLRPLLLSLRDRDLALGVATNDSEAPARAHLAGLLDLLPFVVGYDSGHGSKPGPGQLLAFARHAGLAPAACAMVGDSLHDLVAARAAGDAGGRGAHGRGGSRGPDPRGRRRAGKRGRPARLARRALATRPVAIWPPWRVQGA
jgi:phosphoglycolate phosphatase